VWTFAKDIFINVYMCIKLYCYSIDDHARISNFIFSIHCPDANDVFTIEEEVSRNNWRAARRVSKLVAILYVVILIRQIIKYHLVDCRRQSGQPGKPTERYNNNKILRDSVMRFLRQVFRQITSTGPNIDKPGNNFGFCEIFAELFLITINSTGVWITEEMFWTLTSKSK
jgi:hypothetical protein